MAENGNTWCKKLMQKAKVHALKHKLGNEQGVIARSGGENYHNAAIFNERRAQLAKYKHGVVDGDMPDKPVHEVKRVRKFIAPTQEGWRPQPRRFGMSGCVYRPR